MGVPTFDDLMKSDIQDVFLNGEFSQIATYKSPTDLKDISVQFFESDLEQLQTSFYHAWCSYSDLPSVNKKGDTLEIKGIVYEIKDNSPDEFQLGLNLFLQKV